VLGREALELLTHHYPVLPSLAVDVEAIAVCATGAERATYRLPIDECFRLVGLVRRYFRGASGGAPWWSALARWLTELRSRSTEGSHV
jgi:hypothetical protein